MTETRDELNRRIITEFRANDGKLGGRYADAKILLLHTVGARSGNPRVNPLAYVRDGEDILIIGTRAGDPRHPDWYWNLKAHPHTTVELGTETAAVAASVVSEDEYASMWATVTKAMPGVAEYQKLTTRRMPIIRLART
jgi:deazaflavin-dependent oxidoreductase (nitroreductase family)